MPSGRRKVSHVLVRWAIRIGMGLAGAPWLLICRRAVGLSSAYRADRGDRHFWIVHLVVQFLALRS